MSSTIWVIEAESESGDHFEPVVLTFDPYTAPDLLSRLAHELDGDPHKRGPGYDGSYVYFNVHSTTFGWPWDEGWHTHRAEAPWPESEEVQHGY